MPPDTTIRGLGSLRRRSISTELSISLVLLVVLVEGFLLALIYHRQADYLYRQLQAKADEYAVNLSETLVVPIWDFDDQQIRRIGEGLARNDLVSATTSSMRFSMMNWPTSPDDSV
jgi:hypothetical protein